MDEIDTYIMSSLEKNGRMAFLEIARKLHVSEGTVRKRVAKLVKDGTIQRFTIDYSRPAQAVIGITISAHHEIKRVAQSMRSLGVPHTYTVTGRYDILAIVQAQNREDLYSMVERIRASEGVAHTETFMVLKETV